MDDSDDDCDQLMRDIDSLIGHTKPAVSEPTFKLPHTSTIVSADKTIENGWDVSLSLSDVDVTSPIQENSQQLRFMTPPNAKRPRQLFAPSPFSPMPSYEKMSDERLQAALRGFGLRDKMSRKRMLAVLEKVYSETHQYETDTDVESDTPDKQICHVSSHCSKQEISTVTDQPAAICSLPAHNNNAPNCQAEESDSELSTDDLMKGDDSDEDGVISLTQTNTLDDSLYKIFRAEEKFRTRMLVYEPIPIEELVEFVKSQGLKCSSKSVSKWCFDKCIQLSMKGQRQNNGCHKKALTKKARKKKKVTADSTESLTVH